jgi:hypothetical protein
MELLLMLKFIEETAKLSCCLFKVIIVILKVDLHVIHFVDDFVCLSESLEVK